MASTNKTTNLALNQWVGTDPVLMADFNADNQKLDAAVGTLLGNIGGRLRIATGSYTGTGEYGPNHPNTLDLGFVPVFLFVYGTNSPIPNRILGGFTALDKLFGRAFPGNIDKPYTDNLYHSLWRCPVSVSGTTVSWWTEMTDNTSSHIFQMNTDNIIYQYVAIGIDP